MLITLLRFGNARSATNIKFATLLISSFLCDFRLFHDQFFTIDNVDTLVELIDRRAQLRSA